MLSLLQRQALVIQVPDGVGEIIGFSLVLSILFINTEPRQV